ncbi:MAG: hypothetical protein F6K30_05635 [Cyanothece sp. SIO2G6]|nr:hypothetical protein [Cyanothece sp. SIO2G6]
MCRNEILVPSRAQSQYDLAEAVWTQSEAQLAQNLLVSPQLRSPPHGFTH